MQWILDQDGGFIVRSDAGNYAYAYPKSLHASNATRIPERVAEDMAKSADAFAHMPGVAEYNERMAQNMLAAVSRRAIEQEQRR
jgi:hypothetical protein